MGEPTTATTAGGGFFPSLDALRAQIAADAAAARDVLSRSR